MLTNFIRRNGKRKGNKVIETRHQKSFSASDSSQVASPLVIDINDESLSLAAQSSPLVELSFPQSNEEWFPKELLRRSRSPESSFSPARNPTIAQISLTQEAQNSPSSPPSLSHSENIPSVSVMP